MKLGTKSILFGAHQFILHPILIARGWRKLYGFPWDPRLWLAFIVHDWGYWGKPNMDGKEGKTHPELGGRIMGFLFGSKWGDFCRYHSKSYASMQGTNFSRLCVADKMVMSLEWRGFYLFRTWATGELTEYSGIGNVSPTGGMARGWFKLSSQQLKKWAEDNKWMTVHRQMEQYVSVFKGVSVSPTTYIERRTYPSKGSIFMVGSADSAARLRMKEVERRFMAVDDLGTPWKAGEQRKQTFFHIHPDGTVTGVNEARVSASLVTLSEGTKADGIEEAQGYIDSYNKSLPNMSKRFETIWFELLWRRYYRHMWE